MYEFSLMIFLFALFSRKGEFNLESGKKSFFRLLSPYYHYTMGFPNQLLLLLKPNNGNIFNI